MARRAHAGSRPGSPIGRVHGDASMFVGGIRALMLQSLHPAAMQGVADHSGYRGDMWGRLAQDQTFLAMTTFGPRRTPCRWSAPSSARPRVGDRHDARRHAVRRLRPAPARLGARRRDRQLPRRARPLRPPALTGSERDEYVAQTAVAAEHLGVVAAPRPRPSCATRWRRTPRAPRTPAAQEAIRFLLLHPDLPAAARPGYLALASAAIGLLPADRAP